MDFSKMLAKGIYTKLPKLSLKIAFFSLASDEAFPLRHPFSFSLQWPKIYNSLGQGITTGKMGEKDMIIANILS